jgi:hypothetical protein
MTRGRISRKRVQEALACVQNSPCLLQDLIRFERLKRWTVDLVSKVHHGDRTTAYRHLEKLVRLGCLGKHGAVGQGGGGSTPAVYYLSALGARVLTHALEREQPVTYIRPSSRTQEMHDLAMAELAVNWELLGLPWQVQVPLHYVRNQRFIDQAREYLEYLESLSLWQEWEEKRLLWEAAQRELTELQTERDSLARQMSDLEDRWRKCNEGPGRWRDSSKIRKEIVELRVQKEKLEWFDLRSAEKKLEQLSPPHYPGPTRPNLSWTLGLACAELADPRLSPEERAAALQPESAYCIPDFHTCVPLQDQRDWLVCIEIEARTERQHIEGKYHRYAEVSDAFGEDRSLSLCIVFTSQLVAQRALPQHRRVLNALLQGSHPWLLQVRFTTLDHLREREGTGTPVELVYDWMEWEWEAEYVNGRFRGALHKAYEEEWEKKERQRRDRERKAYWASRR